MVPPTNQILDNAPRLRGALSELYNYILCRIIIIKGDGNMNNYTENDSSRLYKKKEENSDE